MADTIAVAQAVKRRGFLRRLSDPEVLLAVAGFVALAIVTLSVATQMLEPDDYAYQASIAALKQGHILLTTTQYSSLELQLASSGGLGIAQWHHLASGLWISEKNPGYPFFAVIFSILHIPRATPLFFGAIACVSLYFGARAWLGRFAGTYAVLLYCSSGAAIAFAWRDMMPTFTDASLIAFAFGALVYIGCSDALAERRRTTIGLFAFIALEGAVAIRYTNALELAVVIVATLALKKAASWSTKSVVIWMSSVVVFFCGLMAFNWWAYGSPASTGYSDGEISFSISSLWPNLKGMPQYLLGSMPFAVLALCAIVWIVVRLGRTPSDAPEPVAHERLQSASIGAVLAIGWFAMWLLYLTYDWTVNQLGGLRVDAVHVIRFYLPALGCITLLATWQLMRLRRFLVWPIIAALCVAGYLSFHQLTTPQTQFQVPPTASATCSHPALYAPGTSRTQQAVRTC